MASALFTPRMASALFSVMAVLRAPVPRLAATVPSLTRDLAAADVVTAQLEAFSCDDLEASFQFASPANRRSTGTRYEQILADPTYNVLIGNSQHRITSALTLGPDRFACRVVIRPSESSLRCLGCTASVDVGQRVRISSDLQHIKRCFNFIQYEYSELMDGMRGKELEVVCHARENHGTNIVGLPSPDGSQDGVWYFPVTVLEREQLEEAEAVAQELEDAEAAEHVADAEDAEAAEEASHAREEYAFRWELRKQSDHAIAFGLGDVMEHAKYGYRGVVVGFDDVCMQTDEWIEAMGVDRLADGRQQPFYHVLVDERDRKGDVITYVAQENVRRPADAGKPRLSEPVRHRLVSSLLQPDSFDREQGRYEPLPQLRAIYPPGVDGCWMVEAVVPDDAPRA